METSTKLSFGPLSNPVIMSKPEPDDDDEVEYEVTSTGMSTNYRLGTWESEHDSVSRHHVIITVSDNRLTVWRHAVIDGSENLEGAEGWAAAVSHSSHIMFKVGEEDHRFEQYKAWLRSQMTSYLQCELPPSIQPREIVDLPKWSDAQTEDGLSMVAGDVVLFFADGDKQGIVAYKRTGDNWVPTDALKSVLAAGKNPFTQAPLNRKSTRLRYVVSVKPKPGADMVRYLQTSLPPSIQAVDAGSLPEWSSGETENGLLMPMAAGDIVLFFADRTGNTERMHDDQGIVAYTMEAGSGVYKATSALTNTLATKQNPFTRAPLQANDIRLRRVVVSPNEEGGGAGGGPASKRIRLERRQRRQSRRRRAGRGRASTHSRR